MKIEVGQQFQSIDTGTIYTVISVTGTKVEIAGINLYDSTKHKYTVKANDIAAMVAYKHWKQL